MKELTYYQNTKSVSRKDFTTHHVYSKGKAITSVTNPTLAAIQDWADKKYVVEKDFDEESYKAARYKAEMHNAQLRKEFKADLIEYHGLTGHPKADRLYRLSYEHAGGEDLASIVTSFDEMSDLLK